MTDEKAIEIIMQFIFGVCILIAYTLAYALYIEPKISLRR